ncbi:MAG: DNA polymerase III subunit beta [Clostridiales bacterium]|jgi:DNA polymerase-3 subunit beta|nr:DNA polymerase III subunit beta [Clostridiales bacterium]
MKIIVDKEKLLENLNVVSHAVASRTTQQILECVLIKAEHSLRVYGNDLELGIESADIEAEIEEPGMVALEAKIFLEIARKMPAGHIQIDADRQNITKIKNGRTEFKVLGQPGDEFPLPEKVKQDSGFEVSSSDFKEMIRQTIFSVAVDESKPVLTGELLQIKDGLVHLVSVDGFRISYRRSKEAEIDPQISKAVVVPAKSLNELGRILPSDGEARLRFYIQDNHILFETANHTLISRLLDGEFIRYNQIFSEDFTTSITISRHQFLMGLERASLLTRDNKNTPVKLSIGQDTVVITSNTETGTSFDETAADIDGSPLEIAFNPRYLIDALRVIDDENVALTFTGALSPCILRGAAIEYYKYLILPLRLRN